MLQGRPSDLYDAMSAILGLEPLEDSTKWLGEARRKRTGQLREARQALVSLLSDLSRSVHCRGWRSERL